MLQNIVKSHLFYCNRLFHVHNKCKIIRHITQGQIEKQDHSTFRTEKEKNCSILVSDFRQQLARPVPAARVDLRPLVEGSRGQGKHDQVLLF